MQQIVDLHSDPAFQALNVQIVSIAFDSAAEQQQGITQFGIPAEVPMLVDAQGEVSQQYDVLKWAVGTGEPGHTFILVDESGEIAWIRDYGAPPNGVMYVPPNDLASQIDGALN